MCFNKHILATVLSLNQKGESTIETKLDQIPRCHLFISFNQLEMMHFKRRHNEMREGQGNGDPVYHLLNYTLPC